MKKISFAFIITCWLAGFGIAQDLPRGFSEGELQMLAEGLFRPSTAIPGEFSSMRSPGEEPRSPAEWEELQAIVITWASYQSILKEIVRHAKEEVKVIIVTANENSVRTYLQNNGIDPDDNIEFIDAAYNSVWIRDYGANPVYLRAVDSLALVDWIYNRPRPDDDLIPYAVGAHLGLPVYGTVTAPDDLVNTGGNFMSDGNGRGFASKLVLTENGPNNNFGSSNHSEQAVDEIMERYMGIEEYVKMTVLPHDGIHHIDMHMKLLNESTLLVGQYPTGVADGPQIEANLQYVIGQFSQVTGKEYKVIRIPMPPDGFGYYPDDNGDYRTYANAMFINKTILVPVYEEEYDTTALRIWRESMPGYNVVGINCNSIISASGALHCIIKEVSEHRPLWILHYQPEILSAEDDHVIEAQIRHISGIESAFLFYRIAGSSMYDSLSMINMHDDLWSASLPEYVTETQIEYYFKASAMDGKVITRPLPAPAGYFKVLVEPTETSSIGTSQNSVVTMHIYPNPASELTCIPITAPKPIKGTLTVKDLHGRSVLQIFSGDLRAGESKYFFDASLLSPGYYLLDLKTDDVHMANPFVIR